MNSQNTQSSQRVQDSQRAQTGAAARRATYTPDSLLEVAVTVFNERGYDGTSMEDLARAAGITKSSIYHHVKGKEELLTRGVNRALDALNASLDTLEALPDGELDRVEQAVFRAVQILVDELPYVTLLLRVRGNTEAERAAQASRRAIDQRLAGFVERAAAAGALRTDLDPRLASRLVFGMVNSVVEWYRPGPGRWSADDVASAVTHVVFDGLRRR
ncbi:TetR family transcriptional regulator [Catenulispora sp. NF23]|uniref:TetR family transcriptional regulator n=1 Tax=Catenulispora pinistramenti TaxID=2705254 RepID=A0ABS5KYB8_9ACTN|nr:TetR/AcrR family transcriptional regulator [Catenulispora pinistramenti]MBS2536898.1 TetR family transcriptional regulator [Catenulispora pinistramenti]MBS2551056.1 TetR family transcriptional regulator [Catenulispora pinistramenti]